MKRLPLILLCCLALLLAVAEPVKPDLQQIKAEVTNPQSKYYYPKLLAEYQRNETIQTLEDYRHLYLGYLFEEDFDPYRRPEYSELVQGLYFKSKHQRSEADSIIKYAEQALADNPFDLEQIDYLIYALRVKGKTNLANIWQFRLRHILEAIVSTGTGLDPENAWYVVNPHDEYFLLNRIGRVASDYEFLPEGIDHITLAPKGPKDSLNYYFNVLPMLQEYRLKYPE